ncbi:DUF1353 domain-containing protein [Salipiger sp. P9]|uniref:DUF1353 domain-containing protein n=1 Tax=Salipiger pentaromativorans TaxID=2943193 RepID=UPI00215777AD|nr:DUF1353 domain-containing protein [Salipiger pentaromativorans]MCR8550669.1 DUF1353 domain-containing protein [Salipiger pentaromativorans]
MRRLTLAGGCLLAVSACAPTPKDVETVEALSEINCSVRPENCAYENSPVKVVDRPITLPKRPYQFFPLAEPLRFTDARRKGWFAPPGTLTDGASIPKIFVAIVGSPTAPEYVNAAAIHDAYCGIGNEGGANYHNGRWEDVHRMFYDALVASGTRPQRAKIMFAAVWLGGPRWNVLYDLERLPVARKQQAMREAKSYVERYDPSLTALEQMLRRLEKRMIREYPDLYPHQNPGDDDRPAIRHEASDEEYVYEEGVEEYYGEEYYPNDPATGGTVDLTGGNKGF